MGLNDCCGQKPAHFRSLLLRTLAVSVRNEIFIYSFPGRGRSGWGTTSPRPLWEGVGGGVNDKLKLKKFSFTQHFTQNVTGMRIGNRGVTVSIPISEKESIKIIKDLYRKRGQIRELLLFSLAVNTGMMLNDLLNLKVKDVKNKEYILVDNKKSIPLNSELKHFISEFIKDKKAEDYLFQTNRGGKLDRTNVFSSFKEVCRELGLSDEISVASWRKTFGYHHYMQYHDLSYLQWLFNQPTADSTMDFIGIRENMNLRCREGVTL